MTVVKPPSPASLHNVAEAFQFKGSVISIEPHGEGRIHQTYKVTSQKGNDQWQWVLQRLNETVFPDLLAVTRNIIAVTRHLRQKQTEKDRNSHVLTPVLAQEGDYLYQSRDGGLWRAFKWFPATTTFETVDRPQKAYEAARVVAKFHRDLADYDGPPLATTIVDFHHTPRRLRHLKQAVRQDSYHRVKSAAHELTVIRKHEFLADTLPLEELPLRIVHNDPKLTNILFNTHNGQAVCLIDFDTVMPGTVLHDFGDMVRSVMSRNGPGQDPKANRFDPRIYASLEQGYLSVMDTELTSMEKKLLPRAGAVLTFELAVRFLTDYLTGDTYFSSADETDNLNLCRNQLRLLTSMLGR